MAVNVFKDTTFFSLLSGWWDGTETPNELETKVQEKSLIKEKLGARLIVKENDTGNWFTYLPATDNTERGWYDQDGAKKA